MLSLKWQIAQFAELKWWKSYLKSKDKTEYYNWKRQYWQNLLEKIPINLSEGKMDVLDAGCGPAGVFTILENHNVTAFDPLIESYENELPLFKKSDYNWVEFKQSTIEDFKSAQKFDVIFCMNAINHVADINLAYDVLVNHLKPNGWLVVTIDAHNYNFFKHIFRALPGDILHPHQYDLKEYGNFMTARTVDVLGYDLIKPTFLFDHYLLWGKKM